MPPAEAGAAGSSSDLVRQTSPGYSGGYLVSAFGGPPAQQLGHGHDRGGNDDSPSRQGSGLSSLFEEQDSDQDEELLRMPSAELASKAQAFRQSIDEEKRASVKTHSVASTPTGRGTSRNLLVNNMLGGADEGSNHEGKKKKGAFVGVFVPACENMWGVLIFLRFYTIVGQAGIAQALLAVLLSFCCAFCTTSSMSATVSSGGVVSQGGPYYMISRALGPCVGASVGIMYWLAMTMMSVLETLGAVEGILMISNDAYFTGCRQVYGSAIMASMAVCIYGGINLVTKLGIVFVLVIFSTLFMFYFGLFLAPYTPQAPPGVQNNPYVTGLSWETFQTNWRSHYTGTAHFGYVLSVFFPCFTGILSGFHRADILRDPPKNLRQGTFSAIIFSFFMYSSFMILWGMVAHYEYLQGNHWPPGHENHGRRLAGAGGASYIIEEIVWNPFPYAALIGIICSSVSQALQCLVVAPRLLNAIAKDNILNFLNPLAPLHHGEPKRALFATYVVAGLLVLLGNIDLVAPLLSMCFLVAYAFMNFSCFALTWLKSPAWRPKGIQRRRWRCWYIITSFSGFLICVSIMFTIHYVWALIANFIACCLYGFINWRLETRLWGSAMDGIRFQLALTSLIQLEGSMKHHVNWRPQVLILYRVNLAEELKGIKHHEILRFYSQLRKGNGFCVVACVLEGDRNDDHAIRKAIIEKDVIKTIMKEENIQGFAEVVVAPSWAEGTNYIIQLTGIGGIVPNTVLLDWPESWQKSPKKATEFVSVLRTALAEDKAVLAVRGIRDMPIDTCHGTIDIWWMIHDGGFLILLSWLLVQHRIWRKCHMRIFTITEGVTEEQAKAAADLLTRTLRQRRLFDVDVEVILADDEMIEPYTYDWTLRVEERHLFLEQLHKKPAGATSSRTMEAIPSFEINDLFRDPAEAEQQQQQQRKCSKGSKEAKKQDEDVSPEEERRGQVRVSDMQSHASTRLSQRKGLGNMASQNGQISQTKVATIQEGVAAAVDGESDRAHPSSSSSSAPALGGRGSPLQPQPAPRSHQETGTMVGPEGMQPETKVSSPDGPQGRPVVLGPPSSGGGGGALGPEVVGSSQDGEQQDADHGLPEGSTHSFVSHPCRPRMTNVMHSNTVDAFQRLNQIIYQRSRRAQLVVVNLPDVWGNDQDEVQKFMSYCDTLTKGLDRVLFVHSSGHEIFDISV